MVKTFKYWVLIEHGRVTTLRVSETEKAWQWLNKLVGDPQAAKLSKISYLAKPAT